jgi:hypothetical protein
MNSLSRIGQTLILPRIATHGHPEIAGFFGKPSFVPFERLPSPLTAGASPFKRFFF